MKQYSVLRGFAAIGKEGNRKIYFSPGNAHLVGELLSDEAIETHIMAGNLVEIDEATVDAADIPLEASNVAAEDEEPARKRNPRKRGSKE